MSSHHETLTRNVESEGPSDRSFGLTFAALFLVVTLLPLLSRGKPRSWALLLSGAFLLASLWRPSILSRLNKMWNKVGMFLHKIASPVMLALFFFLILTPFAYVMRYFRKDTLRLSYDIDADSYWIILETIQELTQNMTNLF